MNKTRTTNKMVLLPGVLAGCLVWSIYGSASATTYYVAPTGNDANPGTSAALPCLTINHAKGLATKPGDVVQVEAGTYNEVVNLTTSGSATGGKITFRGDDANGCPTTNITDVNHPTGKRPDSAVILKGGFSVNANYIAIECFHIKSKGGSVDPIDATSGTQYVDITDNELDGTGQSEPGGGISFSGIAAVPASQYASHYNILRNYIHGVSTGLFLVASNSTIQDNEFAALQGDEPGSDHDYIDAWGENTIIRHNYMHDNTINACNSYDCHMDCIQTWNTTGDGKEVSKNMTFDGNVCFNHHEGVIVQDNAGNGDVSNWTVTNNVFAYGPYDDGSGHPGPGGAWQPWCWIFEDGKLGNNSFFNNTCVNGAVGFRNTVGAASFKDNILYGTDSGGAYYQTGAPAKVTGANNLQSIGTTFTGDKTGDPKFVSLGTGTAQERCIGCNYSLQAGSPAIDAGANTSPAVTVDLKGVARPQGKAYDIGAYEYALADGHPTALTGQDIGAVGLAGSTSSSNGIYTVTGSGTSMGGGGISDSFQFAYQSLTGDGTIVARLTAQATTDKSGVMIRQDLTPGSPFVALTRLPVTTAKFEYRATVGSGGIEVTEVTSPTVPQWFKLVRTGSLFSSYLSADGMNWTQLGHSVTVAMSTTVSIGLVECAKNNKALTTSTFDNVSVMPVSN
jgi:hypothetical protein